MKVVFVENVPRVASAGEVKEVKDGYGRNYLLPRKLAVPATATALKQLEQQHRAADRRASRVESQAGSLAGLLDGQAIDIIVKAGAQGRLYGSVTNAHLAAELEKATGQPIDRRRVLLDEPIRRLGTYPVTVRLSSEHSATVNVQVRTEGGPVEPAPAAPEAPAAPAAGPEAQEEQEP